MKRTRLITFLCLVSNLAMTFWAASVFIASPLNLALFAITAGATGASAVLFLVAWVF